MAKIINSSADFNQLANTSYSVWKIAIIGAGIGLFYLLTNLAFRAILPISAASGIAIILTAIAGISIMIWQKMVQPLIISVDVSAALWSLAVWFDGLAWFEVAIWCMLLFSIAYILFSGLIHYMKLTFAITAMALIIVAVRVVVGL